MQTVFLIFVSILISVFIAGAINGIRQRIRNNASPKTTYEVKILKIRDDKRFVHRGGGAYLYNWEFVVTYELLTSGKKKRQVVPMKYLDQITKGAVGTLTLQGTRYISFERHAKTGSIKTGDG